MGNKELIIFTVVAIIYFVFAFVTQYFYEEYLWFKSCDTWVPWLQSFSWAPWKRFVRILYLFGWEILWFFVIVFYTKFNRVSSAFLITRASHVVIFVSILKMYWNDPAPYMDRKSIKAFECDQDTFQNPSLEVTISAFTYSLMFYLAYDWIDVHRPRVPVDNAGNQNANQVAFEDEDEDYFLHGSSTYQKQKANDLSYWIYLTLIIYLVFLIAFAGMYIGTQTFDQVLFAMVLGYGLFCVVYYYLKDMFTTAFTKVSEKMVRTPDVIKYLAIHLVLI